MFAEEQLQFSPYTIPLKALRVFALNRVLLPMSNLASLQLGNRTHCVLHFNRRNTKEKKGENNCGINTLILFKSLVFTFY